MTKKPDKEHLEETGSLRAFLLTLPMMLFTFMLLSGGSLPREPVRIFAFLATFFLFNALFFIMLRTGRTDRWRSVLFIAFAAIFTFAFITHYIEARGSMAIDESNLLECKTPFCHIVIPMTIIPIAFTRTVIFPGTMTGVYAAIASMFILWIGASLSLGRGFADGSVSSAAGMTAFRVS